MKIVEKIMNDMAFELTHGREIKRIYISKDYWIAIAHEVMPYCLTYEDGIPLSLFGIPVDFLHDSNKISFGYHIQTYLRNKSD